MWEIRTPGSRLCRDLQEDSSQEGVVSIGEGSANEWLVLWLGPDPLGAAHGLSQSLAPCLVPCLQRQLPTLPGPQNKGQNRGTRVDLHPWQG